MSPHSDRLRPTGTYRSKRSPSHCIQDCQNTIVIFPLTIPCFTDIICDDASNLSWVFGRTLYHLGLSIWTRKKSFQSKTAFQKADIKLWIYVLQSFWFSNYLLQRFLGLQNYFPRAFGFTNHIKASVWSPAIASTQRLWILSGYFAKEHSSK